MAFLPLSLGVRQAPDTDEAAATRRRRAASAAPSKSQIQKFFRRDDYTCRYCGFRAEKFQRLLDTRHQPGVKDEFVTVCHFCEECLSLDRAASANAGVLIWLPEIGQAQLNHLARTIYVAKASGLPELAELGARAQSALLARRTEVKKRLAVDDTMLLATVFCENLSAEDYQASAAKLEGVRLFPLDRWLAPGRNGDRDQFPQLVAYWLSKDGPYGKIPPARWQEMLGQAAALGS